MQRRFATIFNRLVLPVSAMLICASCSKQQPADVDAEAGMTSAESTAVKTYSAQQFYETTAYGLVPPSGHAFSADGKSLLISSDQTGVFNAYALPTDGDAAVALTHSEDNAMFPVSWFPDDDRILYTYDGGGNELNHVIVRNADGSNRDLTPGDNLKAEFLRWSGDGSSFYLLTTERDGKSFDIYRYASADFERERVFDNPGMAIGDLSADGRWVALVKPRTSADADIYLVDLASDSPEPRLITPHDGNIAYSVYAFTPDSQSLTYNTDEHGEFVQAWRYDLESGESKELISAPWDVSYVLYSSSGRYRVSGVNADASTEVTVYDTQTEKTVALPALPPGDINNVRFSDDEQRIALIVDADNSPSNVHLVDLEQGSATQLTNALNPVINADDLVSSTVVRYPSFDGVEIPAILYKPHGASATHKVPALVWVHGGPGGQTRTGYSATRQHLVNHGYAILGANNRGSSGYGKTFFHMDDRHHGEADLDDIVYGRKYLETLDWVDPDRIGVIGGSYGGFMSAAAMTFRPDAFDVGIDIFGVTNWERTLQNIPSWWESFKEALYDEMGDPATDAERHRRISPLFHAGQIRNPMLVIQGANDPRVLKVESDELVAAIRKNEVPVEYIVFPDEGHGFVKRENRITASEAYVRFLDTYLADKTPASE